MAAPVIASKGTASAQTTNSVTPTYPASIAANDIIVCVAHKYTAAAAPGAFSITNAVGGDSWHPITDSDTARPVDGSLVGSMAVWWKRAAGGESGTETVSVASGATGASTCMFAQMYRITGCETSGNPYDGAVFKTAASGTGTTVTFDTVTVSGSERTILGFYAAADNIACATPAGYAATIAADATATGADSELQVFDKSNTASDGSVTAASGLATGIPWGTVHVSFKPPAASGTTYTKTGVVVFGGDATGADVAERVETGKVVLGGVASGADVAEHAETGAVVLGGVLSGTSAIPVSQKTGKVVFGGVSSGADVAEHVESGAVVVGGVASGVGTKAATATKSGTVVFGGVASGADAITYTETGKVVFGGVASSASVAQHTYAKSGKVVFGGVTSGDVVRVGAAWLMLPIACSTLAAAPLVCGLLNVTAIACTTLSSSAVVVGTLTITPIAVATLSAAVLPVES